jgi:hypothetical protein
LAVQVYTTIHCRLIENSIEFHAGVIYSRLFKYTQHTTGLYRTALSSTLELSTLGCSSTHNNSLQVYREQHRVPRWSYLLLAVQVHTTTHCRFIENTIESHAGVIYSRLFKYTQQHTAGLYRTALSPTLELSTLGCSSTHNTLQVYREQH